MNRKWLNIVLGLAFILLAILKTHEVNSLQPYFKTEPTIKLHNFAKMRNKLTPGEQDLLELWESILTGRSSPLSRQTREIYQDLGLKHVFTPSGFHLTAVLAPMLRISSSLKFHLGLLLSLGIVLSFIPGMGALKRMVLIKGTQKVTSLRFGFIVALFLDTTLGTFQDAPLSFAYSFLFLGIIYSGLSGAGLTFWFFIGQILISYFQGTLISPLLLFWSPILNLSFALAMPFLFVLAIPLWDWQMRIGLYLLSGIQKLILLASTTLTWLPFWEINICLLTVLLCFTFRKKMAFLVGLLLLSNSLNNEQFKIPSSSSVEFSPRGSLIRTIKDTAYFTDGKCKLILANGFLWEKCRTGKRKKVLLPGRSTQINS